jgi:photosystem II CP47 chlorophyll apoprotein
LASKASAIDNGDGIIFGWLVHHILIDKEGHDLCVHHMHAFFETFLVVLVDKEGIVKANVPFRMEESKFSVEQVGVIVELYGGGLDRANFGDPSIVKNFVRCLELGEISELDCATIKYDGFFLSSKGVGFLSYMLHILFFYFLDTFGMVLESYSEMFLL